MKVSGHRIGTAEIEESVMRNQKVAEAAVIGIEDRIKGTVPLAFVVIKGEYLKNSRMSKEELEKEIKTTVQKDLGGYARPEHVIFIPQVPKNRSGKVLRRILKCAFEKKKHGNTETLVNPSAINEMNQAIERYKAKLYSNFFLKSEFFSQITSRVALSANDIVKRVQPILSAHLIGNIYDRIHPLVQFIDFFENIRKVDRTITPLIALKKFKLESIMEEKRRNGPCFVLANNLYNELPTCLEPHLISAKMSGQFHQVGFHECSHVAIIIHYEDPDNRGDKGVILVDPNFDVPVPLVFNDKKRSLSVNMGKKRGIWNFTYDGSTITCKSSKTKNNLDIENREATIYYVNLAVNNPHLFALKPILASDTSPAIVSRNKEGRHVAHLKINLKRKHIVRSVDGRYLPIITFEDFLRESFLGEDFCNKLGLPQNELVSAVKKVVEHTDMLEKLRESFLTQGMKGR